MTDPSDDRANVAQGLSWASRITSVSIEMVAPGLLGYWVDQKFGTKAIFCLIGFAIGLPFAMWRLIRMADSATGNNQR